MVAVPSLVWLALGGFFRLFSFGQWPIPLADWLVPIFLLRFSRKARPVAGTLGVWLTLWVAISIANTGLLPVPGIGYFILTAVIGAIFALPYLADRLIAPRLTGFPATLVFPSAWVTMELISARTNPYGTWGAVAYTQYGNLPLMQLASVTGIGGLAFLVCWFGSVLNWVWEAEFHWPVIRRGVLIYTSVWSLTMIVGGARLAFSASDVETIRMAVVAWPEGIVTEEEMWRGMEQQAPLPAGERQALAGKYLKLQDWFLENAQREARAGARIVAWPENSLMVYEEDEAAFLERAEALARQEQIFLSMGVGTVSPGRPLPGTTKSILVNPSGEVEFSYRKNRLVPGIDSTVAIKGDERVLTADTRYGRMASVICYDMDFPDLIQQVGKSEADVLFVPASDWQAIGPMHFRMAVFRAVENGVSMLRSTRWGVSGAVDPYGRLLAMMDDFTPEQPSLVAQVPIRGVHTIYSRIGDWFSWLCAAGLLAAVLWEIQRTVRKR